ncbi:MAG: OmpA family protein [Pseudomonadota bacterium]
MRAKGQRPDRAGKSALPGSSVRATSRRFVLGALIAALTCTANTGTATTLELDTDRRGSDLASARAASAELCAVQCTETDGCLSFTFVPDDRSTPLESPGMCWLKDVVAQPSYVGGLVSGLGPAERRFPDFTPEVEDPTAQYEAIVAGPEADLVLRVGDVDNLGFGWPSGFKLFEGYNTPAHPYPWAALAEDAAGMDRIMVGTRLNNPGIGDGYHRAAEALPRETIVIPLEGLPEQIDAAVLQLFVDDFQAPRAFGTGEEGNFTLTVNGTLAPVASRMLTTLEQTGPIGELVSVVLPPETLEGAQAQLELEIDETSGANDAFAVDFVRLLVNPNPPLRPATIEGIVLDAQTRAPISQASVSLALTTATTGPDGRFRLDPVYAGLAVVEAIREGYRPGSVASKVRTGDVAQVEILLDPSAANACSDLAKTLSRTGRAALEAVTFEFDSATLRPSSDAALEAARNLMVAGGAQTWVIEGHTDNVGQASYNLSLSASRAEAVVAWLVQNGVPPESLVARGFGLERPVASNATEAGRSLNRRVELVVEAP